MVSKHLLWIIGLAVLALLAISFWGSNYPARVTVMNASGEAAQRVTIDSGPQHIELGSIGNGSSRTAKVDPGDDIAVRSGMNVWRSSEPVKAAQSMVIWIRPGGALELQPQRH